MDLLFALSFISEHKRLHLSLGFGAVANVYAVALNCTAGICGNRCAIAGDINLGAKGNHTRVNSNSAVACLCAGSGDACAACVIGGISSYLCADGFGVAHAVYDVLGTNLNDFILCCCDYLFLNKLCIHQLATVVDFFFDDRCNAFLALLHHAAFAELFVRSTVL